MVVEYETDLFKNDLVKNEELYFVYEGPSFDGQMEIPSLVGQLRSTEVVLREVIKKLYEDKRLPKPEDTRLYLKLKKGSFAEIISIVLNHPLVISIVGGCIVALFQKIVDKKENRIKINSDNINSIANNYIFVNEVNNIFAPMQKEGDKLTIYSPVKKEIKTEITFKEKEIVKEKLKELREVTKTVEEDFFGRLYFINTDKESFGFALEGSEKHVPSTRFVNKPSTDEIKNMLFETLQIHARATYRNEELIRLEILSYKIKSKTTLNDYK